MFPWDETAPEGAPHSVRSVAPARSQNYGRFDLRGDPPVLYLAETATHAVAEVLRGRARDPTRDAAFRHTLTEADLLVAGHRLALVSAHIPGATANRVPDANDGATLERFGVRADQLSSRLRGVTQAAARRIHSHPDAVPGFIWSSRFGGDWHVVLLFLDRIPLADVEFGTPEPLHLTHPAVSAAAAVLHLDLPA
ncbi:MAG: RES family NAD+ phosphorylase [Gemmatimonadetes bacterium]|nr:RES family NAD+ phosphorylase [Gemmatimonadota bacterium]